MGWSAHHKMASRQTIVLAAAELFATYGYDAVAIDQVMSHAGKTAARFMRILSRKVICTPRLC